MLNKMIKLKNNDNSIILVSNLFIAIMNFSITIFLIRLLGQKEFGDYVIISNFVILLQVFIGLRTGEALLQYVKKDTKEDIKKSIIRQLFVIDFFINIILYIFIVIFGYFYSISTSVEYNYILLYGIVVIANIGLSIFENIYILNNTIVTLHIIKLVSTIIIFLSTLTFGYFWQVKGVIFGIVSGSLLKNIIHYYYIKNNVFFRNTFSIKNNSLNIKNLFHFFKHAYLSTTFKSGSQGLDIFMLSTVFGSEKIALYEAGKKFAQIPGLIIGSAWIAKSNKIVRFAQNGDHRNLYNMMKTIYKIYIPLGILFSLLSLVIGKDFIELIYGSNYIESFPIAVIFFIFFWFGNLFGGYGRTYFISINKMSILTVLNGLFFFNVLIIGYFFTRFDLIYMTLTVSLTLLFNGLFTNYYILRKSF